MELTPEKLIEMLEKREPLPNVILMYGEENYYRSKAAGLIKKYVFGDVPAEDMEISVFDRDTDLKRLNAAVNTYPFFGGSSLVIISDEKIFAADKKQKENLEALLLNVPEFCHVFINIFPPPKPRRCFCWSRKLKSFLFMPVSAASGRKPMWKPSFPLCRRYRALRC